VSVCVYDSCDFKTPEQRSPACARACICVHARARARACACLRTHLQHAPLLLAVFFILRPTVALTQRPDWGGGVMVGEGDGGGGVIVGDA